MINPGKLNQRIEIFKIVGSRDEYGEPITTKKTIHECIYILL